MKLVHCGRFPCYYDDDDDNDNNNQLPLSCRRGENAAVAVIERFFTANSSCIDRQNPTHCQEKQEYCQIYHYHHQSRRQQQRPSAVEFEPWNVVGSSIGSTCKHPHINDCRLVHQ